MTRSYYSAPIREFVLRDSASICGILANNSGYAVEDPQRFAWQFQIPHLLKTLQNSTEGHIFVEFQIPRSARRADVILLIRGVIIVLEYKVGGSNYDRSSIEQVTDYALDLKNFHSGSHHLPIIPMLIATAAPERSENLCFQKDGIASALLANEHTLGQMLSAIPDLSVAPAVDPVAWEQSPYSPTPTIVEAAQALYRGHNVSDISRSDAGAVNLTRTSSCVAEIIRRSEAQKEKTICFLTGVPGAGKTLAGLNIVTADKARERETAPAVFLSGNGPLVMVLREALALDEIDQQRTSNPSQRNKMSGARRKASAFIQNIHHFRDDNLTSIAAPVEHVVVFDEAQRAWDRAQTSNFMRRKKGVPDFDMSEPEFLLSVMDRHQDWCCVVCLIGGGQEINIGEAGMVEWLSALQRRFTSWVVYSSDQMGTNDYSWNADLLSTLHAINAKVEPDLHLSVSLRSFRAESLSAFVSAIIGGDAVEALRLRNKMPHYPVAMTRNLVAGRSWLREHARGTERYGILASSNAIRLKPSGIH